MRIREFGDLEFKNKNKNEEICVFWPFFVWTAHYINLYFLFSSWNIFHFRYFMWVNQSQLDSITVFSASFELIKSSFRFRGLSIKTGTFTPKYQPNSSAKSFLKSTKKIFLNENFKRIFLTKNLHFRIDVKPKLWLVIISRNYVWCYFMSRLEKKATRKNWSEMNTSS